MNIDAPFILIFVGLLFFLLDWLLKEIKEVEMNEKDIQRKIDLQLDHLRNEFNERLKSQPIDVS